MTTNKQEIYIPRSNQVGVLLLHSFTGTPAEFSAMAEYLSIRDITVYAPLLPGHGTNPKDLAATSVQDWKDSAAEAYLKMKDEIDRVFVVGSSFGGNLALWLAVRFPNLLDGVISLGTPVKVRRHHLRKIVLYTYGYFIKHQKKLTGDYLAIPYEQRQMFYPVMPIRSLRNFFNFIKFYTIPNLKKVLTPTLIVQSISDRTVDPLSAQYLYDQINASRKDLFWVDSASHLTTFNDKKDLIFHKIYRFVSER